MKAKRRVLAISIDYPIYRLYKLMDRKERELVKNIFEATVLWYFKKEPLAYKRVRIDSTMPIDF
ncbi:MAG: hypothetical protein QW607_10780 [Desulfurococcaceae archaeon]